MTSEPISSPQSSNLRAGRSISVYRLFQEACCIFHLYLYFIYNIILQRVISATTPGSILNPMAGPDLPNDMLACQVVECIGSSPFLADSTDRAHRSQ